MEEEHILVYFKGLGHTASLHVDKVSEHIYSLKENDLFIERLTQGTQIEVIPNDDGSFNFYRISKKSALKTRRYMLSINYNNKLYQKILDEFLSIGGFCQVDMGGIVTINYLEDIEKDIDRILEKHNVKLTEI